MKTVLILSLLLVSTTFATNVALNKPAEATAEYGVDWLAEYTVDGNLATCWNTGTWAPPVQSLTVDLLSIYSVNEIDLWTNTNPSNGFSGFYVNYDLYVSTDKTSWHFISSGTLIDTLDPHKTATFPPMPVRYVRYDVTGGTHWAHLYEMQVYQATESGEIVGWGDNTYGQAIPPEGNDFIAIAAGFYHSLALKSDGSIVGWGDNDCGQATPPAGNDFIAVATGYYRSLALKSDGSIVSWGWNSYGQATPPEGNDFIAIAARYEHNLALKSDGSIVGWGTNYFGEATPPAGNDFIAISVGLRHSLALKSDGSIVGWGYNDYGQATPPEGNDFIAIAAGDFHCLALKSDGSIVGWGYNDYSQATPPEGNDFIAIAAGSMYSLTLKSDGSIFSWGYNDCGQATSPEGNDFIAIAAGGMHSLALHQSPAVDLNNDYRVDMLDFALFATRWLEADCKVLNNWCQGADFDWNGQVDLDDLAKLAENWLQGVVANLPPLVDAGQDQTIIYPVNVVNLDGTVTDDGLPNPPSAVTTLWTVTSGPDDVIFGDANAVDTTANFVEAGEYVLRLTANDGDLSSYDEVIITVNPPLNQPPVVDAGADREIILSGVDMLDGTVTDDGLPNPPSAVTTLWTVISGSGLVTFGNANAVDTMASFSEAGIYVLRLTANDGELQSYDDVTITVNPPQDKSNDARACAESGLEIVRCWFSHITIPGTTPASQQFAAIAASLQSTAATMSNVVVIYNSTTITIPTITLDWGGRNFSAVITSPTASTLQIDVTGRYGSLSKTVRANYTLGLCGETAFNFGVASKGPVSLQGNVELEGVNIVIDSNVYIESENSNFALWIIGNAQILGDVSIVNPNAYVDLQGENAQIGGETGWNAIEHHVQIGVPPTDFPTPDPDYFRNLVTLTNLPTNYGSQSTFENVIIPANRNPSFGNNTTFKGLLFIEAPNKVTFNGSVNITGIVVGNGDLADDSKTNTIIFSGNVNSYPLTQLPSDAKFNPLRNQAGTFLMAPGFAVSFGGNFHTLNGAVAANGVDFYGNAGGTINGSVLNYSDDPLTFQGNSDLYFKRSNASSNPAGFLPKIVLLYDPNSYQGIPDANGMSTAEFLTQQVKERLTLLSFANLIVFNYANYEPPKDVNGDDLTELAAYRQKITVENVQDYDFTASKTPYSSSNNFIRVTVDIYLDTDKISSTNWIRAKY